MPLLMVLKQSSLMQCQMVWNNQLIAFASRMLSTSESNYAQLKKKEVLALIFGVRKFHMYSYGRPFTLVTDKPLQCFLAPMKGIPLMTAAVCTHGLLYWHPTNMILSLILNRQKKAHAYAHGL